MWQEKKTCTDRLVTGGFREYSIPSRRYSCLEWGAVWLRDLTLTGSGLSLRSGVVLYNAARRKHEARRRSGCFCSVGESKSSPERCGAVRCGAINKFDRKLPCASNRRSKIHMLTRPLPHPHCHINQDCHLPPSSQNPSQAVTLAPVLLPVVRYIACRVIALLNSQTFVSIPALSDSLKRTLCL